MNENNKLKLREGSYGRVLKLAKGKTIFFPCKKVLGNARILDLNEDGSISVHWEDNYNTSGDFRTELMQFDSYLVMDDKDFEARNAFRVANNLIPIDA